MKAAHDHLFELFLPGEVVPASKPHKSLVVSPLHFNDLLRISTACAAKDVLVGCRGEQILAFFQETSKWVNTQSHQHGSFVQAIKGPLNPQSYPTFESYLQVREPKSITSGLRAAQKKCAQFMNTFPSLSHASHVLHTICLKVRQSVS